MCDLVVCSMEQFCYNKLLLRILINFLSCCYCRLRFVAIVASSSPFSPQHLSAMKTNARVQEKNFDSKVLVHEEMEDEVVLTMELSIQMDSESQLNLSLQKVAFPESLFPNRRRKKIFSFANTVIVYPESRGGEEEVCYHHLLSILL